MARFDVYRTSDGLLLDVQADSLPYLITRLVVPLFETNEAPRPLINTLNPVFNFDGHEVAMMTQYAAAVVERDLGNAAGSLARDDYAIGRALDMLITGI
jgi:toxin CcdB